MTFTCRVYYFWLQVSCLELATQDQDFCELFWALSAQNQRNMMNKLRILFTDFNKLKLINFSAHTNEKVQFGWLWLTLNMTSPLFLILQKSLQTLFWERKLREKSRTKRNLSHLQPEKQKICFSLISWALFSLWILE